MTSPTWPTLDFPTLERLQEGVGVCDRAGRLVFANSAMARIAGVEAGGLVGPAGDAFWEHALDALRGLFDEARESRQPRQYECRVAARAGPARWLAGWLTPLVEKGRYAGMLCTAQDVSERKLAQQRLEEAGERFRSVVDDQTEVISRFLPDGTFLFANDVFYRVFGQSREALIGHRWHPVAHPDDRAMIEARLHEISPGTPVVSIENRVRVAGGEERWMHFINRGFFDAEGQLREIQSVGRDITEQKKLDDLLRTSRQRMEFLLAAAPVIIYTCGPQPPFGATFVSQNVDRILGFEAERFTRDAGFWAEHVHPGDLERVLEDLEGLTERETNRHEYRFRLPDGSYRWMLDQVNVVRADSGEIIELVGYWIDITERKLVDLALQESEERLEMALEGAGLAFWDWDMGGARVLASQRVCEMLGRSVDELVRQEAWLEFIDPAQRGAVKRALEAHLRGETPVFEVVHRFRHRDGHWVTVESRGKVLQRDADGSPMRMVGTLLDISQRKRLDEEGTVLLKRIESLIRDAVAGASVREKTDQALECLTNRERQVLGLIAEGMTSAQIGAHLQLATNTVINHRQNMMVKLNLHNTAEITRFAIDHGLIKSR